MDARTNSELRLPSRHMTEGPSRAAHRSSYPGNISHAALHPAAIKFDAVEIFKKPPYVPGLKPTGRYVAKDIDDVGSIPLLMKMLLDNGHLQGDCLTVTGRPIAETLMSEQGKPHQDVVRLGDVVEVDAGVGGLNVKLTDVEPAERKTKWMPRKTNHTSGVLWRVGPGVDGAVAHPGAAYEKQCYADI